MKYCTNCGKEIDDLAVICVGCGCSQKENIYYKEGDSKSFGWAFLGFLFPIVGLILWLLWKDSYPMRAKSLIKGTITGVLTGVALAVLFWLFYIGITIYMIMNI